MKNNRLSNAFAKPHPALEPSHAIAAVARRTEEMQRGSVILANLCGRGDKDIFIVAERLGGEM